MTAAPRSISDRPAVSEDPGYVFERVDICDGATLRDRRPAAHAS